MFLTPKASTLVARGGVWLPAGAAFATGALIGPVGASRGVEVPAVHQRTVPSALRGGHEAEVLRVIDGDTFEARVHIWPGMDVTTKVRLRGIDAQNCTRAARTSAQRRWPRATRWHVS